MFRERLFGSTFLLTDNNNDDYSQLNIPSVNCIYTAINERNILEAKACLKHHFENIAAVLLFPFGWLRMQFSETIDSIPEFQPKGISSVSFWPRRDVFGLQQSYCGISNGDLHRHGRNYTYVSTCNPTNRAGSN